MHMQWWTLLNSTEDKIQTITLRKMKIDFIENSKNMLLIIVLGYALAKSKRKLFITVGTSIP